MTAATLQVLDALLNDVRHGVIASPGKAVSAALRPLSTGANKGGGAPAEIVKAKAKCGAKPDDAPPTAAKPEVAKAKAAAAPQAKAAAAKAEVSAATPPPTASAPSGPSLPATEALYQTDTYLFTASATVLGIQPLDGDQGWAVMLDSTCFHPQGGGQPADTGTITNIDGGEPFAVKMVKKDLTGVVAHQGSAAPSFGVGAKVKLSVEGESRVKNARVHSAGHLIDVAMTSCGVGLKPTKGYHFTPGAYVEYDGKLDAAERDALVPRLQASMDELIAKAVPTVLQTVDAQKLDTVCPPNALPADRNLWGSGWVRVVCVGGLGCPCGGTHVRDTKELGRVKVEGIKVKGKVTRVSYTVE